MDEPQVEPTNDNNVNIDIGFGEFFEGSGRSESDYGDSDEFGHSDIRSDSKSRKKFAKKYVDGIPRMLAWEMPKRLTSSAIDNVEVKSTLISTKAELAEVYWQELTPCVEEEDTTSQDFKRNETKHDA
ncbi:Uncharacterized protein Fot_19543 [Forsythia ovata]|uniref:Uncharacterized protein n=1 Tax=Forsythia ovata TaxID=205694 RepID=A0ABD1VLB4_9LAMI